MRFLYTFFLLFACHLSQAQTPGCTDPQATNFSAAVNINNGSCLYNTELFNPPLRAQLSNTLAEISGMIYFDGKLLALNDGGGGNKMYLLDTTSGNILQTITVTGATNIDWEDLAQDSSFVYVGDIGNNADGNRKDLCIYKIDKNAFLPAGDYSIPVSAIEKIQFKYEDQNDFTGTGANKTKYDCEAIVIARGQLHLFTKNWIGNYSVHYILPIEAGNYEASRRDSMNTNGFMVTGADLGAYDELLMTAYNKVGNCAMFLVYGFDSSDMYFNTGNKRQIPLPGVLTMGQLESVCFVNALHGFISNEKFVQSIVTVSNKLRSFSTLQWVIDYYKNIPLLSEKGMLRYNSTTDKYEVFSGFNWEPLH